MQLEDMILVSVDDHLVEPPSMSDFFMDHFPAKYRDQVPTVITKDDGTDVWLVQGHEVASFGLNAVAGRVSTEWGMDPGNFGEVRAGTYDVHERVRDMNINGVLGSMCFSSWPGLGGQYFLQSGDTELAACMIRAYNDWHIEEWAGAAPGRFIPLALSGFMLGAEWMAGEIRRVAEKGCHAISFHSEVHRFGMPDHHGDEWDPAWQACDDTDSVMVFHFGGAPNFMPRSPFDVLIHTMPFNTGVFCSELLWSPVLRKFPNVKFALAEGGIGWIPYWLERADYVYQRHSPWTLQDFGAAPAGLFGTLVDERADVRDVSATIVDLAVRVYPRIEELQPDGGAPRDKDDRLVALKPADDRLRPYEALLLGHLFAGGDSVELTRPRCTPPADDRGARRHVQGGRRPGSVRLGPDRTRRAWTAIGVMAVLAAAAVTGLRPPPSAGAWWGWPWWPPGSPWSSAPGGCPPARPRGPASATVPSASRRSSGSRRPTACSSPRRPTWSPSPPYAVARGCTERWARRLCRPRRAPADVVRRAAAVPLEPVVFGTSIAGFSSWAATTLVATPGGSGGSGFSGGFSGGGVGGGGVGSW